MPELDLARFLLHYIQVNAVVRLDCGGCNHQIDMVMANNEAARLPVFGAVFPVFGTMLPV